MEINIERREIPLSDKCVVMVNRRDPSELEIKINEGEIVTEDDLWSFLKPRSLSVSDVTRVTGRGIFVANQGGISLERLRSVEWGLIVTSQGQRRGVSRLMSLMNVDGSLKVDGPIVIPNVERVGRRCELQNGASLERLRSVGMDFVTSGVGTSARMLVSVGGMAILEAGCAPELRYVGGEVAYCMSTLNLDRQNLQFCHASCKDGMGTKEALEAGVKWIENRERITEQFENVMKHFDDAAPVGESLV